MSSLEHKWQRWQALPPWQKRLLVKACAWMPLFWCGLRLLGLNRLLAWVERRPLANSGVPSLTPDQIRSAGQMVNTAALYPPYPQACLARSLLLVWWLRGQGVQAHVVIGIRMTLGRLDAHAWAEWDGKPINDRADIAGTYTPFGQLAPLAAFK